MRYHGINVQDNPAMDTPLHIRTEDASFSMMLQMEGSIIGAKKHTPTDKELDECPHIILTSTHEWGPSQQLFPQTDISLDDEIQNMPGMQGISSVHQGEFSSSI